MNCRGMTANQAMTELINLTEQIDPSFKRLKDGPQAPHKVTEDYDQVQLTKEGSLYKQRDVFKGWRPRHFILQDSLLSYYVDASDPNPKNTLDISGCTITPGSSFREDDVDLYPFVIIPPHASTSVLKKYHLSADTLQTSESWILALREAAAVVAPFVPTDRDRDTVSRRGTVGGGGGDDETHLAASVEAAKPFNPSVAISNIPNRFRQRVERAVQAMLVAVGPAATGWEPMFEKEKLKAQKRTGWGDRGDVICVRGDEVLNHSLVSIFDLLVDPSKAREVNPQVKR